RRAGAARALRRLSLAHHAARRARGIPGRRARRGGRRAQARGADHRGRGGCGLLPVPAACLHAPVRRLRGQGLTGPAPRRMPLTGLHHVTLICADLERTTAFYRDVLGLALVREGTNDDDPDARHFWFGDAGGTPGTLVSFLEYPQLDEGHVGRGSTHHL